MVSLLFIGLVPGAASTGGGCNAGQKERMSPVRILQMADPLRYRTMTTEQLRNAFLIDDLFHPGQIGFTYVDLDRTVIGSAVPTGEALFLPADEVLKASYFTEPRGPR